MPYVHFANGEHRKVTQAELDKNTETVGHSRAFRDNGTEHHVVGIYPDEVPYELSEDEKATNAENEQYAEWKRSRDIAARDSGNPNESESEL